MKYCKEQGYKSNLEQKYYCTRSEKACLILCSQLKSVNGTFFLTVEERA
jgi:hypothetical protein